MKRYADLHIHTALSPCASDDMTPNNIVNMAKLKGLDIIAITDHNSAKNVVACCAVGDEVGIKVIPGIELQTKEDIHVICLFKELDKCLEFDRLVEEKLIESTLYNKKIGNQIIYDENDNVVGEYGKMLLASCDLSVDEAFDIVTNLGGVFIPAHIDRRSFSIISSLGFIPPYLDIKIVEVSKGGDITKLRLFNKVEVIVSSDAHDLFEILEQEAAIDIEKYSILKKI